MGQLLFYAIRKFGCETTSSLRVHKSNIFGKAKETIDTKYKGSDTFVILIDNANEIHNEIKQIKIEIK